MNLSTIQLLTEVAAILCEIVLVGVLLWRKAHRSNPAFFLYVLFTCLHDIVLLAARNEQWTYFHVYYGGHVIQQGILVAVAVEILLDSFRALRKVPRGPTTALAAGMVWVVVTIVLFTSGVSTAYVNRIAVIAKSLDRSVTFVLFATFLFIALFSSYLDVPWKRRAYGVGLGFLFSLPVQTVITWLESLHLGSVTEHLWVVWISTFFITQAVWFATFLAPDSRRFRATVADLMRLEEEIREGRIEVEGVVTEASPESGSLEAHSYWLRETRPASHSRE